MNIKVFFLKLICKIQSLVLKLFSLTFLTWCVLFIAIYKKIIIVDGWMWLTFTACVIGLKSFYNIGKKNEEKKDSGQNIALKCKRLHSGLITQRAGSTPGYATKRIVSANETIIKLLI